MFSIDTESDFAFLEDAWGVTSKAKDRYPTAPSSKQQVVSRNHTEPPSYEAYQERKSSVNESSPLHVVSPSSQSDTPHNPEILVRIQNPILHEYFHVYKDEYRDKIIENILLHHVQIVGDREKRGQKNTTTLASLGEKMKTILSQTSSDTVSQKHENLLLITWFAIAFLLFLLLIKGGR